MLDNSSNCKFASNGERRFIEKLFEDLKYKNDIVLFDVGGNIGDYTEMLQHCVHNITEKFDIHLFEPTEKCFDELSSRFDDERIHLNQFACSDENGHTYIYYDQKGSTLASLHQRNQIGTGSKLKFTESIETVRLDDYIKQHNIQHIDFMKIDVEGHEASVLEGMGKYLDPSFVDLIQFEYGGANLDSMKTLMYFYGLFESKGFVISKILPNSLHVRKYDTFSENFEYGNYVAISKRLL